MRSSRSLLFSLAALALSPAPALAAAPSTHPVKVSALEHALLSSRELWATVDVCNPADQRNWVGLRGSMPGDGHAHDKMYMSFRLQYMNTASKQWVDVAAASSAFVAVGTGASARQDGTSFKLEPEKTPFTLRGVVNFQWRRGKTVVASATRPTTAGHHSVSGADPVGFSAATCPIG
jgi:hypothetical protein